jgi:hypothetical protein
MSLFQTTLWTTELVSIFITLREIFYKEKINPTLPLLNYTYNDYLTNGANISLYYDKCVEISLELRDKLTTSFGY